MPACDVTATDFEASPKEIPIPEILISLFRMSIGAIAIEIAGCPKRISVAALVTEYLKAGFPDPGLALFSTREHDDIRIAAGLPPWGS